MNFSCAGAVLERRLVKLARLPDSVEGQWKRRGHRRWAMLGNTDESRFSSCYLERINMRIYTRKADKTSVQSA